MSRARRTSGRSSRSSTRPSPSSGAATPRRRRLSLAVAIGPGGRRGGGAAPVTAARDRGTVRAKPGRGPPGPDGRAGAPEPVAIGPPEDAAPPPSPKPSPKPAPKAPAKVPATLADRRRLRGVQRPRERGRREDEPALRLEGPLQEVHPDPLTPPAPDLVTRHLLNWDETLFRDPEVFDPDFVPEQFNFREAQMRELACQLRPGLRGARPLNTVVRGPPGTGKTTTVRNLFTEVEETTKMLVPIYINCQIDNTTFGIISGCSASLSGHLPRASGTSTKKVFDAVARVLEREQKILVVALDDANYLLYENELNRVLYSLLRTHEVYRARGSA